MIQIHDYEFGRIAIEGTTYTSDIIVSEQKVSDNWRRDEGHRLQIQDLQAAIEPIPEVMVIGTGYYGRMSIPEETLNFLKSKGIKVFAARTMDAVDQFNRLQHDCANIVAALHLTC